MSRKREDRGGRVSVILPVAVARSYTYLRGDLEDLQRGDIVEVPFGLRRLRGVVDSVCPADDIPEHKLKSVSGRIDAPALPEDLMDFVGWVARYNVSFPGLFLKGLLGLAGSCRRGERAANVVYCGVVPGRMTASRQKVLGVMRGGEERDRKELADRAGVSVRVVDDLVKMGVLERKEKKVFFGKPCPDHDPPVLNEEQQAAVESMKGRMKGGGFQATLLEGVTGSGKTEVYFEIVAEVLRSGRQALILLPEIALTGQFLDRFEKRFGVAPAQWHSDLGQGHRGEILSAVRDGRARVVMGARSALFLPFLDLGLIVVDEEHDGSYKQEELVCYHARDMAVKRCQMRGIPIILSTATPSVETWCNAVRGRYGRVELPARFGDRKAPHVELVDLRRLGVEKGSCLSHRLREEMGRRLECGEQVLLFLNRRGYAPLTLCGNCGWRFECRDCSACLVEHRIFGSLVCHQCGYSRKVPDGCPNCGAERGWISWGPGVEKVAEEVERFFPAASRTVLSSDLMRRDLTGMQEHFREIAEGKYQVIIGTQLIAKGHHFPGLSLVGVVDGDLGLGCTDLRASEKSFQLLRQVVGRSGRGEKRGFGMIQTHMPEHPVMQALISGDDTSFYEAESGLRKESGYPPFGRLAALVVSSGSRERAAAAAHRVAGGCLCVEGVRVLGPAEAPLSLIRGRFRYRLLLKGRRDIDLGVYVRDVMERVGALGGDTRLRVDMDPQNFL